MASTCSQLIRQNIQSVVNYSSFSLMGLGQYYQCLKMAPKFTYNFLTIQLGPINDIESNITAQMGLCLPSQCSKAQILSYSNEVFHNMSLIATTKDIQTNFPEIVQFKYNWTIYLLLIVFISTLGLMIYSTIMIYLKKRTCFDSFCLQQTHKFFRRNPKNNLNVFNGLKALAMMGVILVHSSRNLATHRNSINIQHISLGSQYLIYLGSRTAVGIFFFIGGFLVSFVVLKQVWKSKWTALTNIFHRALRIWPTYFFCILLMVSLYAHLADGPKWYKDKDMIKSCDQFYFVMFFVNQFYGNGICIGASWYLHVDMQFYCTSMLILMLYKYNRTASKIVLWVISTGFFIKSLVYSQNHNSKILGDYNAAVSSVSWQKDQYLKPWLWVPTYYLGLFIGMLYHQYQQQSKQIKKRLQKNSFNMNEEDGIIRQELFSKLQLIFNVNKYWRIFVQILGAILMIFIIFIPRTIQVGIQWPQALHSLYLAFSYFIFVFGAFLTILPSMLSCKHSIMTFLMDTQLFNFMSKISFATYLVHLYPVIAFFQGRSYSSYYSPKTRFVEYIALSMFSMLIGFFVTILIQIPFGLLHKKLIKYLQQKQKKEIQQNRKEANDQQQMIRMNLNHSQNIDKYDKKITE